MSTSVRFGAWSRCSNSFRDHDVLARDQPMALQNQLFTDGRWYELGHERVNVPSQVLTFFFASSSVNQTEVTDLVSVKKATPSLPMA